MVGSSETSSSKRHATDVTNFEAGAETPQLLLLVTLTVPDVVPHVTLMLLVPCPVVMVAPVGTVQLKVKPDAAETLYTFNLLPLQSVAAPVIALGCVGKALPVINFVLAELETPQMLFALTLMVPLANVLDITT